jgi:hypothetical protein
MKVLIVKHCRDFIECELVGVYKDSPLVRAVFKGANYIITAHSILDIIEAQD